MNRSLVLLMALFLYFGINLAVVSATATTLPPKGKVQNSLQKTIEAQISRMSLEEKIGQLFIIAADGDLVEQIHNYHVGGVVLFSRHAKTLPATMQLIEKIRRASPIAPFIAVDQEGGRVSRLSYTTQIPSARNLEVLSEQSMQNIGKILGSELHALGFNLNFAPVMDVDTCAENPVIGDRAYSANPYTVAKLGSSVIKGLHSSGILSAAKHFPGHGDTRSDSHFVMPVVNLSQERLDTIELLPFRAAQRSGIDMIMVAHVHYPALDPTPDIPASLSKPILTGLLRQEMNFNGIIITDAMNMRAITDHNNSGDAAKAAFNAGVDIILMPDHLPTAYHTLLAAVQKGEIPIARVDESVRRILSLKFRFSEDRTTTFEEKLKHAVTTVGSSAHQLVIDQILRERLGASPIQ